MGKSEAKPATSLGVPSIPVTTKGNGGRSSSESSDEHIGPNRSISNSNSRRFPQQPHGLSPSISVITSVQPPLSPIGQDVAGSWQPVATDSVFGRGGGPAETLLFRTAGREHSNFPFGQFSATTAQNSRGFSSHQYRSFLNGSADSVNFDSSRSSQLNSSRSSQLSLTQHFSHQSTHNQHAANRAEWTTSDHQPMTTAQRHDLFHRTERDRAQPRRSQLDSAMGSRREIMKQNSGPERSVGKSNHHSGSGFSENFPEEMGVISHHGPLHPSYATPEARLRTFREWPPALKQQPKELADAGFYYIGLSDQVKCFYCDGGLRNWQPEDDPWMEHARWFKKCVFVRLKKGDEFIKQCLAAKPPENSQEDELRNEQREVTEDEVRAAMSEAIVRQVLSMGIDASRVKMAIKRQLEKHGAGFNNPEHLIRAAFSVQRDQERRVNNENNNPSGALLGTSRGGGASADIVPRSQEAGSSARGVDEVTSSWEVPPAQPPQAPRPAQPMSDYDEDDEEEEEEEDDDDVEDEARPSRPSPTISSPSPAPFRSLPPAGSTSVIQRTPQYNQSSAAASSQSVPSSPVVLQTPPKEDPAKLEEENQRLKEQRTCKVCMDGEVGVVFLPCGHLICCVNCAPSLKDCPVCRTLIQGTVRTFMS